MGTDLSEFKKLFLQTANDYLAKLEQDMQSLKQNTDDARIIHDAYISAHSLKGQSLAMGYSTMGKLSALIERIFSLIEKKQLTLNLDILSSLQQSLSVLRLSLRQLAEQDTELDLTEEITALSKKTGVELPQ